MITKKDIFAGKRDKVVGRSLYRICNTEPGNGTGKWYIREFFNNGIEYGQATAFVWDDLTLVLDVLNMLSTERAIIDPIQARTIGPVIDADRAYAYFENAYKTQSIAFLQLLGRHRDARKQLEKLKNSCTRSRYSALEYVSCENIKTAIYGLIRDIRIERLNLRPVPDTVLQLDLKIEEQKINTMHRILHISCRRNLLGYGDPLYHNIRAYLISRIEQASDSEYIVDLDGADPSSVAKIRLRKEYLMEKYGSCQGSCCRRCSDASCKKKVS